LLIMDNTSIVSEDRVNLNIPQNDASTHPAPNTE